MHIDSTSIHVNVTSVAPKTLAGDDRRCRSHATRFCMILNFDDWNLKKKATMSFNHSLNRIQLQHIHPKKWLDSSQKTWDFGQNHPWLFFPKKFHPWRHPPSPIHLRDLPLLFRRRLVVPDVALLHVSVPDAHGFCTLGTSVDWARGAAEHAKVGRQKELVEFEVWKWLGQLKYVDVDVWFRFLFALSPVFAVKMMVNQRFWRRTRTLEMAGDTSEVSGEAMRISRVNKVFGIASQLKAHFLLEFEPIPREAHEYGPSPELFERLIAKSA